jgi:translation initiation factor IF-2
MILLFIMKFNSDDTTKLPFQVEIRKKNGQSKTYPASNKNNNIINNNLNKIKEIEEKSQQTQENFEHLKKSLEGTNKNVAINPLKAAFQQREEAKIAADKLLEKKRQEQQNQRLLYEEYKRKQSLRSSNPAGRPFNNNNNYNNSSYGGNNNYNNKNFSQNNDYKKVVMAPKFNNQISSMNTNNSNVPNSNYNNMGNNSNSGYRPAGGVSSNYKGNNPNSNYKPGGGGSPYNNSQSGGYNNQSGGYRGTSNYKGPPSSNYRGGGANRPNTPPVPGKFNIYNTGIVKNILNNPLLSNNNFFKSPVGKKPGRDTVPPKKKKILKAVDNDFDWKRYVDNEGDNFNQVKNKKNNHKNKDKNIQKTIITITQDMNLSSLSKLISVPTDLLVKQAKDLGVSDDIYKILEKDALFLILDMNDYACNIYGTEEHFDDYMKINKEECEDIRPPVICVVGHVDHGKTSFLDNVRKTSMVDKEAGGITQNISLWQLDQYGKAIFIDTPGHSVFSVMRKVGLALTDIVILLIAADDGVKDQTIESMKVIAMEKKNKPIKVIVGITKIDKVDKSTREKNLGNIYNEMTKYDLLPEVYGGEVKTIMISNKTGEGVKEVLETIEETKNMISEELLYNKSRGGIGLVVNTYVEKGIGTVAYVLLKQGNIKLGDKFLCGNTNGKVRLILLPKSAKTANSENIIKITGFENMPKSGDDFIVINDDKLMKDMIIFRNKIIEPKKEDSVFSLLNKDKISIILKADTAASLESLENALTGLSNKISIEIFSSSIGSVMISDVEKAIEFNLVIVAFNSKIDNDAIGTIKNKNIKCINDNIIYRILEEIEILTTKNETIKIETIVGTCEVRHLFTFNNIVIAGSRVLSGSIFHSIEHICEIFRKDQSIFKGTISSMKKDKDNVKEGKLGTDVGIIFDNFNKIEIGDIIKCYKVTTETKIVE